MSFSQDERHALCDLFDELGPDAPTLCEGWTTHDLAAHLWLRETDPLAVPGMFAKPLEGLTERRMESVKKRLDYAELVDRIRRGPIRLSLFALPGMDEQANGAEYFVHHEDARRAQGEVRHLVTPRELPDEVEDQLWKRLKSMGRAMFRGSEVGVTAERLGPDGEATGDSLVLKPGERPVVLHGKPSEIMLFAFGRGGHAAVELSGEAEDVVALQKASFGI